MSVRGACGSLAILTILCGLGLADPEARDGGVPATLMAGTATHDGPKLDRAFAHFKLDRLRCKFSEEKHIALLARPLKSTGTILFDREKGIVRTTLLPKPQQVVLTRTSLRIRTDKRTEEIPLDKSKDLRAFALIFPTLLRGDRVELERTFEIGLRGSETDWWALSFVPRTESLRKLVKSVVVVGRKADVFSLQVIEGSGDTTDTRLTDVSKNGDVSDAEIATGFGAR